MEARGESWSKEQEDEFRAPIRARYETEGNPYFATARLWDDGIIAPSSTRACSRFGPFSVPERSYPGHQIRGLPDVIAADLETPVHG